MSATHQEVLAALIALYAVARVDRDEDYAAISIAADVIERAPPRYLRITRLRRNK